MKMSKKTRSLGRNKRHLRVRKRLAGTQDRPRVSLFRSNINILIINCSYQFYRFYFKSFF